MSEIKRFDPIVEYKHSYAHAEAGMDQWEGGDYVLYEEHVAEVEKLRAEIAQLQLDVNEAYTKGYLQGLWGED